ncbi:GFA family protein [Leisingera sp. SS27]|nr:GFA family protein [Leisingera sp. SS27]MDC0658040.1 GFA family protein [Leisingera sp. SS27]
MPVLSVVNCHCESCRRQCSAPMTTYIGVKDGQWRWTGAEPRLYRSSPKVERTFCRTCGSPLSFRSQAMSGTMHFYAAAMADPEAFAPSLHVAHEEKLCWLNSDDGLPKRNGPEYL